uniref:tRNA pseudouridine synthase n=1 Tax=Ditylenchus dipsaci TaxID=166011 RepID=A0A915CMJ3_9BILA
MLVAYQGKNYFGMQIQKDAAQPTIEFHLLKALFELGYITEEERIVPNKFYFQRAARTDKGVSAVRQMCSMFLPLNEDLAKSAHKKEPPTFNAQKGCDYRTYSYTLPTYAFAPTKELTNNAYRISEERLKEVNETLNKFVGTHNFYNYTSKKEHSDKSCILEFLSIYVKGQSFMLHQIRKMIVFKTAKNPKHLQLATAELGCDYSSYPWIYEPTRSAKIVLKKKGWTFLKHQVKACY